jgi:tetratricopeptide (TPR) repeat protein
MKRTTLVIVLALMIAACKRPDDQKTESIEAKDMNEARADISPAARAQLDSGNTAYKAKEYDRALAFYQRVTELDKDAAAGWFGIYMTELARGNAPAADSALRRAQKQAPGASLIHPKTN